MRDQLDRQIDRLSETQQAALLLTLTVGADDERMLATACRDGQALVRFADCVHCGQAIHGLPGNWWTHTVGPVGMRDCRVAAWQRTGSLPQQHGPATTAAPAG